MSRNELIQPRLIEIAKTVMQEKNVNFAYKFGTMIEIPRAAVTAKEIAEVAEFFSFGTNDLTQMTFGYSRDDAERNFLVVYVEKGILPKNPFQTIDQDGVGALMRKAVQDGRETRSNLEVGICGEHGGDPASIEFCHTIGQNYVSCSPFRVPVARLAAVARVVRERDGRRPLDTLAQVTLVALGLRVAHRALGLQLGERRLDVWLVLPVIDMRRRAQLGRSRLVAIGTDARGHQTLRSVVERVTVEAVLHHDAERALRAVRPLGVTAVAGVVDVTAVGEDDRGVLDLRDISVAWRALVFENLAAKLDRDR